MTMRLTIGQQAEATYEIVLNYVSTHGYGPTFRELSALTGLSLAYLHQIVERLREDGALVNTERGIIYPTRREERGSKPGSTEG